MTTTYRIVIRGLVSDRALEIYLDEFVISRQEPTTVLTGPIADAAQLHGVITHLTGSGLELLEVTSSSAGDHAAVNSEPN